MANQVQATILNVNGSNLSPSQSLSFAINSVWLQQSDKHGAATVICALVGGAKYYASEAIGDLVTAGLVQVTVIQVNNARQEQSIQMAFPASLIDIKASTLVSGAITAVTFNGSVYYVSESEASIVEAANAGGGGGGVESVVAGDGISVDDTDPANPVVSANPGYLVYVARVSQSGSNAPTVTALLQNTLGGTVVWSRLNTGVYYATLAGAFPEGRTIVFYQHGWDSACWITSFDDTDDRIMFESAYIGEPTTPLDSMMNNVQIEIRVYPA